MTRNTTIFKLTRILADRLKARGTFKEKCTYCGEPFKIGDYVVSKFTGVYKTRPTRRKWYHVKCAKRLNIIISEKK
jgi:hypothetical protein